MEANPESERTTSRASSAIFLDPEEPRGLLASLSRELSRPLFALRDELAAFSAACSHPDDSALELSTSCDRLLDLTRDFFDYARIARDSPEPALEALSISSWLSDVDRRFATLAEARDARWLPVLEGDDFLISTDRARLDRLVDHLLSNALKHRGAAGLVQARVARSESEFWRIAIVDDGPGITAEDLDKLFEPFVRTSPVCCSGEVGNGLGLALARVLTESLGGEIHLESTLGQGTRAIVRLPIATVV